MSWRRDIPASIAVFLVALPLCLGIALASGAPLMSGLIAGIVGGLVVGSLSGSHTSVSGPAAGLVAIVLGALATLESFDVFLLAVFLGGLMQLGLGIARAGGIAHFFPSAVIRGLLAAIGLILILKQIPHAVGYDADAEGEFSFFQPDGETTFSELFNIWGAVEPGAAVITVLCILALVFWDRSVMKKSPIPGPLVAVVLGTILNEIYRFVVPNWTLGQSHRVLLPEIDGLGSVPSLLQFPDFTAITNPQVYVVAVTLAIVASLETLLNLEAADKLDVEKRVSPPNRELLAQGVGNTLSGLLGGLPVTAVIVRSSVNIYSGARTKASAIMHGGWLAGTVVMVPELLNRIPLSALAAILLVTGYKLANARIVQEMWRRGMSQFVPFLTTVVAIVFTDLLIGILIGLAVGIAFVLRNLLRTPFLARQQQEMVGNVIRLKFGQHVTFFNRAKILKSLDELPEDSQVILDATATSYIDPDVLEIICEFRDVKAPSKNIRVSLIGFRAKYSDVPDRLEYVDVVTQERQQQISPAEVLRYLEEGNKRFVRGETLERDYCHQVHQTCDKQHPIAAVLGCIDSRTPAELIFDLGLGDIFSVRVAGNVVSDDVLASLEYASEVAGVKLIVVLGHTGCGAVTAACQKDGAHGHVPGLLEKIRPAIERVGGGHGNSPSNELVDRVSRANVEEVLRQIPEQSPVIAELIAKKRIALIGAMYDLSTGRVEFIDGAQGALEHRDYEVTTR